MLQLMSINKRGFIFVAEIILALIIFSSFISVASNSQFENIYASNISTKQLLNSTLTFLDQNSSFVEILDRDISNSDKMNEILNKVTQILPSNYNYKIALKSFDANLENCKNFFTIF